MGEYAEELADAKRLPRQIPLTLGKVAIVDADDFDELSKYKWFAQRKPQKGFPDYFYACRQERSEGGKGRRQRVVMMHNQIMPPPPGMVVDHRNRNGLDNRKENLRHATNSQNMQNKRYRDKGLPRGVSKIKISGRFRARIRDNGVLISLGCFDTAEEAARAYDKASLMLHGEFGIRNFAANDNSDT